MQWIRFFTICGTIGQHYNSSLKCYRGWPESSGCFFLWAFLKFDSLSLGLWERMWFVSNQSACFGALISYVLIGPGWASQIWEMLKRKNSHLILVTLDNTSPRSLSKKAIGWRPKSLSCSELFLKIFDRDTEFHLCTACVWNLMWLKITSQASKLCWTIPYVPILVH